MTSTLINAILILLPYCFSSGLYLLLAQATG
jgi:hypothetical protein